MKTKTIFNFALAGVAAFSLTLTSCNKQVKEILRDGMMTIVYGLLEEVKPIATKKGDKMAFIKLSDYTSSVEGVVFPRTLREYEKMLVPDTCVAIKGKFSLRNGSPSIIVEKLKVL